MPVTSRASPPPKRSLGERKSGPLCAQSHYTPQIGIKYDGIITDEVEGAHNDVDDMKRFLVHHYSWREEDLLILKDDGTSTQQPTRDVIVSHCAIQRLLLH